MRVNYRINRTELPPSEDRNPPTPAATVEASRSSSRSMSSVCGAVSRTTSPPILNISSLPTPPDLPEWLPFSSAGITNSKPVSTSSSTASLGLAVGY